MLILPCVLCSVVHRCADKFHTTNSVCTHTHTHTHTPIDTPTTHCFLFVTWSMRPPVFTQLARDTSNSPPYQVGDYSTKFLLLVEWHECKRTLKLHGWFPNKNWHSSWPLRCNCSWCMNLEDFFNIGPNASGPEPAFARLFVFLKKEHIRANGGLFLVR